MNGSVAYLHITLDEIERSDSHMSKAAAEYPADRTRGVELGREHLNLAWLAWSRNHEGLVRSRRRRSHCEVIGICCHLFQRKGSGSECGGVKEVGDERLAVGGASHL